MNQSSLNFMDSLTVIGQFIGTYGLAVFLVLYYALKLYPQVEAERGKWIEEITRLRQLVDPATRSLTRQNAEAILKLAAYSFFGLVTSRAEFIDFEAAQNLSLRTTGPSVDSETPKPYRQRLNVSSDKLEKQRKLGNDILPLQRIDPCSFEVWGETFEIDTDLELMDIDKQKMDLEKLFQEFTMLVESQDERTHNQLIGLYKDITEISEVFGYHLARLNFGNNSLEEVWKTAAEKFKDNWYQEALKVEGPQNSFIIENFLKFAKNHPAYPVLKNSEPQMFPFHRSEKKISLRDFVSNTHAIFERYLLETLNNLEEVVVLSN